MLRRSTKPIARRSPKVKPSVKKRRAAKRARAAMIATLDAAARERIVVIRDQNICQRCGAEAGDWDAKRERWVQIQWSHIYSREYLSLRWNPCNSLAKCAPCHCWFTNHHTAGIAWFSEAFPARWQAINAIFREHRKVDIATDYQRYMDEIETPC